MLIEFSIKNFRSIKEQQKLSLVASKYKELNNNTFNIDDSSLELVNSCAIYGANSAGKSNIVKALRSMQKIVIESASESQRGEELAVESFLLNQENRYKPTEFEVIFIKDNIKYQYGFSATKKRICEEWLIVFETKRPQYWFERFYDEESKTYEWKFGDKFKGQKKIWQNATRENSLFLSIAIQLNSEQLKPIFDWFKKIVHIAGVDGWDSDFTEVLCKNENEKKKIINFLHNADLEIDDIKVELNDFDINKLPSDFPNELIKDLKDAKVIDTKIIKLDDNGKNIKFDLKEHESDGTQKLFAFAGPWIDTLENGNILFIDELHDNLHPLLVKY